MANRRKIFPSQNEKTEKQSKQNDTMTATATSDMPVFSSDTEIDPAWIQQKMPQFKDVIKCTIEDISNEGRKAEKPKDGATLKLNLTFADPANNKTLIIKQVSESGKPLSQQLGLAREALFFNQLASKVKFNRKGDDDTECIPKVYYSWGDMASGSKIVVMEDLSNDYLDSGILFGPGNPNNWKRDLPAKIAEAYPSPAKAPSSAEVANETFLAIAQVHATFWKSKDLLKDEYSWLRGANWVNGNDEASWKASQGLIQGMWASIADTIDDKITWDPLVKSILTKAMDGISWEAQLERLNANGANYTLAHGDFWPGNVMISKKNVHDLKCLDWEMVGVGSGPQDLGQYVLSNMDPQERRDCEAEVIRNYHNEVVRLGVDLSWEECWKEYTIGGLERWLWFLVYFCGQSGPLLSWAQFFHDQVKEFVHDHGIKPEDVTQPRP
ncbi:MAG: hypothetical protein SGILL_001990 [Bacillariaceae sp.]